MNKILLSVELLVDKTIKNKINKYNQMIDLLEQDYREKKSFSTESDLYFWRERKEEYIKNLNGKKTDILYLTKQIEKIYLDLTREWIESSLNFRIFKLKTRIYNRNYKNKKLKKIS